MTLNSQAAAGAPQQAPIAAKAPTAVKAPPAADAAETPEALPAIPPGGGRVIISERGDDKIITYDKVPPQLMPLAHMAQDTALGLMGLLAAIFILGPFARMIARRMERRPDLRAAAQRDQVIQQQMHQMEQLQQSVDAMSVEIERISESQRFQSKLMVEKSRELTG